MMKSMMAAAILALGGSAHADEQSVLKELPKYTAKHKSLKGTLNAVGSDTLLNLMTFWSEEFRKLHPNVTFQIEGKGSSTAPAALTAGTAQLGPMSREMKSKEIDEFEKKYGYKPTAIKVALDALAVFVHRDNPIKGLSMDQVDAIFSKNRKLGHQKDVKTWGDIGVTGALASMPLSLYGRNTASGTYGYFKHTALGEGDFKDSVREQPGSAGVVQAVGREKNAIGYSGMGYRTADVRLVPIAEAESTDYFEPNFANASQGKYPLARHLLIYVGRAPGKDLDPMVEEFVRFVQSREGQEVTLKDGFLPISKADLYPVDGKVSLRK
jgi:phosphate transport system substrate-binding protein